MMQKPWGMRLQEDGMNAQINNNVMAHLIDKDALVAKIEKRRDKHFNSGGSPSSEYCYEDDEILSIIDTLEVKEVDLEKDIQNVIHNHFFDLNSIAIAGTSSYATEDDMIYIAKHFFELGLKASNPITSADRGTAEEIIINLKKIESDYNVCLTKEIEWVRKQVGQP